LGDKKSWKSCKFCRVFLLVKINTRRQLHVYKTGETRRICDNAFLNNFRYLMCAKLRIFSKQWIRSAPKFTGPESLLKQIFYTEKRSNRCILSGSYREWKNSIKVQIFPNYWCDWHLNRYTCQTKVQTGAFLQKLLWTNESPQTHRRHGQSEFDLISDTISRRHRHSCISLRNMEIK
jgi:hypothetical protein